MAITTNMGLTTWASGDSFNDAQLRANWQAVDLHDHTTGKGKPIPANGLQKDSVTETKIADGSVTSDKIVDASVSQYKLAPDLSAALDRAKISLSENTIFGSSPASSVSGGYNSLVLNSLSVSDVHISNDAYINPSKINIKNANGQQISSGSGLIDINSSSAGGAVLGKFGASTIAPGAIANDQLSTDAVTNAKILNGTIQASKFAPGVIDSFSIPDGSITPTKLAPTPWTSFSHTIGAGYNGSVSYGSSNVSSFMQVHNKTVNARYKFVVDGFTHSGAALFVWSLPSGFTCAHPDQSVIGIWKYQSDFARTYYGNNWIHSGVMLSGNYGTTVYALFPTTTSANPWVGSYFPTTPYAWATSSGNPISFSISLTYQAN